MDLKASLRRGPFDESQADSLSKVLPGLNTGQIQWLNGYLTGIEVALQAPSISQTHIDPAGTLVTDDVEPIWILYGTATGNSESLAKDSAQRLEKSGRKTKVVGMDAFKTNTLKKIKELLIIVSTDGEGDPPLQAEGLLEFLRGKRAPKLDHISYSILALGDSSYAQFCQTGKDFDSALAKKGAKALHDRVDCDVDYEDNYEEWITNVLAHAETQQSSSNQNIGAPQVILPEPETAYNRKNPFKATVLEKINLNGRGSAKETIHLELDLEGSHLKYEPGDALGIYGLNKSDLVDAVLKHLHFTGDEGVETHEGNKSLREALTEDYELTILTVVSLKHFAEITGSEKIKNLIEDKEALTEYLYGRDILDLLQEEEYEFTPQSFLSILRKNMPRMYSIASSQEEVEDEVHILVSSVRYEAYGRQKEGVCSTFLADQLEEDDQVKVFIDPNNRFKLPDDSEKPVIMVGPGTGIAPFRSFLQHREAQEAAGKSWLFFGDRNFTTDFLYQSEWLQYHEEGLLTRLDVAFSRDQEEKVYVQHKMLEKGKELFTWLEEGAHFYVCGDKDYMAKDVDNALISIIKAHGNMEEESANNYVKELRKSGRYQVDVY